MGRKGLLSMLAAATLFGCVQLRSDFRCVPGAQSECGAQGVCESSGFCSFLAAADCPGSGRRYGHDAPPDLANQCVGATSLAEAGGPIDAAPGVAPSDGAGGPDAMAAIFDGGGDAAPTVILTAYHFSVQANCSGTRCYCDEAHDQAAGSPNPAGTPGTGCSAFGDQNALGQLTDGVKGVNDAIADLGNGQSFEWVGWNDPQTDLVFIYSAARNFTAVTLGINNKDPPNVTEPAEVLISFSNDGVTFGTPVAFRLADATLPAIPVGTRADVRLAVGTKRGRHVKITLREQSGTAWMFIDEVGFE